MSEHYVPISAMVKKTEGCHLTTCHDDKGDCQAILIALSGMADEGVWSRMPKEDLAGACQRFDRFSCPNLVAVLETVRLEK